MGHFWSVAWLGQNFPPSSKFNPDTDIPDLTGRVIIVTGGNTGIGKETIRALLKKNAKVYMASRSREKAESAIRELKADTGREAIFLQLDLANLDAVKRSVIEFRSKETELHVLFNSGGVMVPPIEELTADGYDLQFGTNVLGHAHLTLLLVPELAAGAKTSPDGKARVINTSSAATYFVGKEGVQYSSLRDDPSREKLGKQGLYIQSKFAKVLFSNELAKRYADQGIISNSVNPGNINTDLQRHYGPIAKALANRLWYPASYGALTQLWAGVSPETKDLNGQFLIPWARLGTAGKYVKTPGWSEELWDWIEEQRKDHC